jgi:flagellar basal body-associated protein FliL
MKLFSKIENAINFLLIRLGELFLKLIPSPIKNFINKVYVFLQSIPALIIVSAKTILGKLKLFAESVDIRAGLIQTYQTALAQAKAHRPEGMSKLKTFLMTPFLMIGQWLNGLSAGQSLLLLTFTSASFLSVIGIGFSGQKMFTAQSDNGRLPASTEETIEYTRPEYYKKQTKHFEISQFRLPVYFADVNEIRSVDIDFIATLTNRSSRMFLEKHEFHLRDHLILQLEPSVAAFPLEDEGKEIIRQKLLSEINDFLKLNEIEGHVTELKISYVLAN